MVECNGFESRRSSRIRGFESLTFRKKAGSKQLSCFCFIPKVGNSIKRYSILFSLSSCSKSIYLKRIGVLLKLERRNNFLKGRLEKLLRRFDSAGVNHAVVKWGLGLRKKGKSEFLLAFSNGKGKTNRGLAVSVCCFFSSFARYFRQGVPYRGGLRTDFTNIHI